MKFNRKLPVLILGKTQVDLLNNLRCHYIENPTLNNNFEIFYILRQISKGLFSSSGRCSRLFGVLSC